MNYSEPRIVLAETLEKRSYITFSIDGKRVREYTGHAIKVQLSPNKAETIAERNYLLELLCKHFEKALADGLYVPPTKKDKGIVTKENRLGQLDYTLRLALESKKQQNLAPRYIKHLEKLLDDFMKFLPKKEHHINISKINNLTIDGFLQQFNKSSTYYMTKRRHFKVLLAESERLTNQIIPSAKSIARQKPKPKAHIPYSAEELQEVFRYLRLFDEQLYICTMICYGCWLRPHNEVRRLRARNFKDNCTKIVLDADKNKSGRIRSVRVPEQITVIVRPIISILAPDDNIFTKADYEFTDDYFSRKWQRARKKMLKRGIIDIGHTIYSFRHTAAIDLYRRTRDVSLLQRIMGHVEVTTTMTYLRGLGELNEQDWEIGMPTFY